MFFDCYFIEFSDFYFVNIIMVSVVYDRCIILNRKQLNLPVIQLLSLYLTSFHILIDMQTPLKGLKLFNKIIIQSKLHHRLLMNQPFLLLIYWKKPVAYQNG